MLPIKAVYKLFSEFNAKNIKNRNKEVSQSEGIPVKEFVEKELELNEMNGTSVNAIMKALGYPVDNSSSFIDWDAFLKV